MGPLNAAVVHEWFEQYAGSERVVEQLLHVLPGSDVYALVDFLPADQRHAFKGHATKTSFIQRLPLAKSRFRNYLPLMPMAIEQFDLSGYDLVISSNHAFAKGVITRADQMHISYVHTPLRYAWDLQHEYLRQARLTHGLKNMVVRATLHYLRTWDRITADRVDVFVANSRYIAQRIRKTYRRPAYVVYPPVDVNSFTCDPCKEDFYLTASRLVPYKRVDLIVQAFANMPNRQLIVIGDGSEWNKISKQATPNVKLLGHQPFEVLLEHMQKARAFVFAGEEDFGIVPVEAQACGTPVIAFGRGGVRETVIDGQTGLFFDRQTSECLQQAVVEFERRYPAFCPEAIRVNAERFGPARFRREMTVLMDHLWNQFDHHHRNVANANSELPFPLDPSCAESTTAARSEASANFALPIEGSTHCLADDAVGQSV